jgi:hypothetical protein
MCLDWFKSFFWIIHNKLSSSLGDLAYLFDVSLFDLSWFTNLTLFWFQFFMYLFDVSWLIQIFLLNNPQQIKFLLRWLSVLVWRVLDLSWFTNLTFSWFQFFVYLFDMSLFDLSWFYSLIFNNSSCVYSSVLFFSFLNLEFLNLFVSQI